jgi:hypothetical protein
MRRKRTIESIRRERAFERSWKGCAVSWLLLVPTLAAYLLVFGIAVVVVGWDLNQGGLTRAVGIVAAAGGVFLWLAACSPLSIMLRRWNRRLRRRRAAA